MSRYKIVYERGIDVSRVLAKLAETVNANIEKNWIPKGGHVVTITGDSPGYQSIIIASQAMIYVGDS